jgi:predicted RNA-binding protein YlxR (DUF448 family)
MKNKKLPLRSCVITRERFEKKDLIRVVKTPEGKIVVDLTGKANGRGAYLRKDAEIFVKARKTKALDRHLEMEIPSDIYDELDTLLK